MRNSLRCGLLTLGLALATPACFNDDPCSTPLAGVQPTSCTSQPPANRTQPPGGLTQAQKIDHFITLAFGSSDQLWKWQLPITVVVHGGTAADRAAVQAAAATLSGASGHSITVVTSGGNVDLHVVPRAQFDAIIPGASPTAVGRFQPTSAGLAGVLGGGKIVVSSDVAQEHRTSTILHELTHMIGLLGHNDAYPASILYPSYSPQRTFTEQDRFAVAALYRADMKPNMTSAEARQVLAR